MLISAPLASANSAMAEKSFVGQGERARSTTSSSGPSERGELVGRHRHRGDHVTTM